MDYSKQLAKWAARKAKFQALVQQGWTLKKIGDAQRPKISKQRVQQIVGKEVK